MEAGSSRNGRSTGLLFVSYARQDSDVVDALLKDIDSIRFEEGFEVFRDNTSISSGESWDTRIERALQDCNLAVLVVSVNYWSSSYIREKELPILQQRYMSGEVEILPVLAGSVSKRAGPEWIRAIQFFDGMNPLPHPDSSEFRETSVRLADEVADRFSELKLPAAAPIQKEANEVRGRAEVAPSSAPTVTASTATVTQAESAPVSIDEAVDRAIEHFREDQQVQQWLATTGQTPWMNVQSSLEEGLKQQGVAEADLRQEAYNSVVKALDRIFGPKTWYLDKRPRKNDPEKTTTWIVLGSEEEETSDA